MKNIGGFFDKVNSKIAGEVQNRVGIIEIFKKNIGIDLEMKDMSIRGGILRIKSSPAEKNEIYMKKERIIREINQKVKNLIIKDLR